MASRHDEVEFEEKAKHVVTTDPLAVFRELFVENLGSFIGKCMLVARC